MSKTIMNSVHAVKSSRLVDGQVYLIQSPYGIHEATYCGFTDIHPDGCCWSACFDAFVLFSLLEIEHVWRIGKRK